MSYITRQNDISVLPLSIRSLNCLRNAGIYTIGELLKYPSDEFIEIPRMGKKSVEELQSCIYKLREGTGEFVLDDAGDSSADLATFQVNKEDVVAVFVIEAGIVVHDIRIVDLPLPDRAKNCLTINGYEFASQLANITCGKLTKLRGMGKSTAEDVIAYIKKITVQSKTCIAQIETDGYYNDLAVEMYCAYGETKSIWLNEILAVKAQFPEAMCETLIDHLYDSIFVRGTVKAVILKMIEDNDDRISMASLEEFLPKHLSNTTILGKILHELESFSVIEIDEAMIYRQYLSIIQYAAQIQDERQREVLQGRLGGKTLQEIGEYYGITREWVRQLERSALRGKPYLREDKYIYIYDHYDFSLEDFSLAFDEQAETYYYLEMICATSRRQRKPLDEILTDTTIDPKFRKKAERAIYRYYIYTDGVCFKKTRPNLVKHFVKTYCKELTECKVFLDKYKEWLETFGLGENTAFTIESNDSYQNKLSECDFVLWHQRESFRYYNIPERDFEELLSTIDLEKFEDTVFSTLRLFKDYPDLMRQYDIHDEYELHNLLKKIWPAEKSDVKFGRMPTIKIGKANVSDQVISLLLQYAPISKNDLVARYEEKYGVKRQSAIGNYLKPINNYYFNGAYSIDYAALPSIQFDRMKSILDRDFYTISDVKKLYKREFPNSDDSLINPYTMKTLGFHVYSGYSGYIVKNTFAGAADYFRSILTHDIVDINNYDESIRSIAQFFNELGRLRSIYEMIEFSPSQYINIRRLEEAGITKGHLKAYCSDVAHHYEKGEYFTVLSLQQEGFVHELDKLGFDDWFYSSILLEDRQEFSYQNIGGTRLFLCGKTGANLGDMLVWLLGKYQKIDFYDLMDILKNHYGIKLPKDKLITIIGGTELYYDTIMEAVYIDYDTYFEEI